MKKNGNISQEVVRRQKIALEEYLIETAAQLYMLLHMQEEKQKGAGTHIDEFRQTVLPLGVGKNVFQSLIKFMTEQGMIRLEKKMLFTIPTSEWKHIKKDNKGGK